MAEFGFHTVYGSNFAIGANTCWACRFQYTAADATMDKLVALLNNFGASCYCKALLYADSSSTPAALLATGTTTAFPYNEVDTWTELPISYAMVQNTYYWMGVIGDANAAALAFKYEASTSIFAQNTGQTYASPDNPFGTAEAGPTTGVMSLYGTTAAAGFTGLTVTRLLQG